MTATEFLLKFVRRAILQIIKTAKVVVQERFGNFNRTSLSKPKLAYAYMVPTQTLLIRAIPSDPLRLTSPFLKQVYVAIACNTFKLRRVINMSFL